MKEQTTQEFWTGIICGSLLALIGALMLQDAAVFDTLWFQAALFAAGCAIALVCFAQIRDAVRGWR